jgi:hypothetical protein
MLQLMATLAAYVQGTTRNSGILAELQDREAHIRHDHPIGVDEAVSPMACTWAIGAQFGH